MSAAGVIVALSMVLIRLVGIRPAIPFSLILIFSVAVPFAFGVAQLIGFLERRRRPPSPAVSIVIGCAVLALYWPDSRWLVVPASVVLVLMLSRALAGPYDGVVRKTISTLTVFAAIYVVLWNLNYLALLATRIRLQDGAARFIDAWVYSAFFETSRTYSDVFPLTRLRWLVIGFERAYIAMFAEVALIAFLLTSAQLRLFVARMCTCYAVGLLIFVIWPVAGPYLVYPRSIDPIFTGQVTREIMQASLAEFSSIRLGGQPLSGFGYFVGFPSLHVAMAILMQCTLVQRSRVATWTMAPLNALMVASTFVLGFHYLVDVFGGVALAWLSITMWRDRVRTSQRKVKIGQAIIDEMVAPLQSCAIEATSTDSCRRAPSSVAVADIPGCACAAATPSAPAAGRDSPNPPRSRYPPRARL